MSRWLLVIFVSAPAHAGTSMQVSCAVDRAGAFRFTMRHEASGTRQNNVLDAYDASGPGIRPRELGRMPAAR